MTIVKECKICGKQFATRTFKSATWENYCNSCFAQKRQTRAVEKMQKHNDTDMVELRDRVIKVEEHLDNIPAITHAEINNQLANLSDLNMFDSVKDGLEAGMVDMMKAAKVDIDASIEKMKTNQKRFQQKIQKQLLVLNNKLIQLIQEME